MTNSKIKQVIGESNSSSFASKGNASSISCRTRLEFSLVNARSRVEIETSCGMKVSKRAESDCVSLSTQLGRMAFFICQFTSLRTLLILVFYISSQETGKIVIS